MRNSVLIFLGTIISVLTLLYLLFSSIISKNFIIIDWFVVAFDITARLLIDIELLKRKDGQ